MSPCFPNTYRVIDFSEPWELDGSFDGPLLDGREHFNCTALVRALEGPGSRPELTLGRLMQGHPLLDPHTRGSPAVREGRDILLPKYLRDDFLVWLSEPTPLDNAGLEQRRTALAERALARIAGSARTIRMTYLPEPVRLSMRDVTHWLADRCKRGEFDEDDLHDRLMALKHATRF